MAFVQAMALGVGGGGGTTEVVGGDGGTGGTWAWTMDAMSAAMAIAAIKGKASLRSVKTFVAMAFMTGTRKP